MNTTRVVGDGSGRYRIRVRHDGYIIGNAGESPLLKWATLHAFDFLSPLAVSVSAASGATPDGSTTARG